MIHEIHSDLPKFKAFAFKQGLNVILAQKSEKSARGQTRNRAGKSSFVETVHFLLGADTGEKSPFHSEALKKNHFGFSLDVEGKPVLVERENSPRVGIRVDGETVTLTDWQGRLGKAFFNLPDEGEEAHKAPSFRTLISYFARRESSHGLKEPQKIAGQQGTGDTQTALMYLLGLDWTIAREWDVVRELTESSKVLKKAANSGQFSSFLGKSGDLRTQHVIEKGKLDKLQEQLTRFQVLPEYYELEKEANSLTEELGKLSNENTLDAGVVKSMQDALREESAPAQTNLEAMFKEAGVVLPDLVKRRYDEVREFHASVIRNRHDYLSGEINAATARIQTRNTRMAEADARRQNIMGILKSRGALDQFVKLQAEVTRLQGNVEWLGQRLKAMEQLEGAKAEIRFRQGELQMRLQRNFSEQETWISQAIRAYEEISGMLYEKAGSMQITHTESGPEFSFQSQGARSKGIKNMQIFCFDMMLMMLCAQRKTGPGFLIHDSHLFDGVDGRQLTAAMKAGAEISKQLGFQYIVTLNEDDAFKEPRPDFDLNQYVLPTCLTDATEDGGFFGFRFD